MREKIHKKKSITKNEATKMKKHRRKKGLKNKKEQEKVPKIQ
jgi:hypothetical protein